MMELLHGLGINVSWTQLIFAVWITGAIIMFLPKKQTDEQKLKSKNFRKRLDYKHPDKFDDK